eukprot:9801837-Alexandrium_andersonii.AAC.2
MQGGSCWPFVRSKVIRYAPQLSAITPTCRCAVECSRVVTMLLRCVVVADDAVAAGAVAVAVAVSVAVVVAVVAAAAAVLA